MTRRHISARTAAWAAVLALGWAAGLLAGPGRADAAPLTSPTWSLSKTTTGATGTGYTYAFTVVTASALSSVTMTVPSGTGGSPAVGTVSPATLAGGSVTLASGTLTYSFSPASIAAGTAVSIRVTGLTNTATSGSYTSVVTTKNGASAVDTGTTGAMTLTAAALTSPGWAASATSPGASANYTYTFTTATTSVLDAVTMTVPPGTGGTLTVGTVTPVTVALGGSVALSGTTLTYSFTGAAVPPGTAVSVQILGFTNTAAPGSYPAEITTQSLTGPVDSGVTAAVTFAGPLMLTSPGSLAWDTTLTGLDHSVTDTTPADQQLTANDATVTGAGWHVTVSATTFTNGTHTLPSTGTLTVTGSITSATASSTPSTACVTSCTPPADSTSYPVAVTTAGSAPPATVIYDTAAGSGTDAVTLGGHSAPDPLGWWLKIPANAPAGTYTSTVTVAVVSGP